MKNVIYTQNGTWWEYKGSLTEARKLRETANHTYYDGTLGPLCLKAQERPMNYFDLPGETQWDIDKQLGILDWNGQPNT